MKNNLNMEIVIMSEQQLEAMVRRLAREHFELEQGIERVVWFKNGEQNTIHLLEVNRDTFPEDAVLVFYHRATRDFPLAVRLADVTPEEWDKVNRGLLSLPEGWSLNNIEVFEREKTLAAFASSQPMEA